MKQDGTRYEGSEAVNVGIGAFVHSHDNGRSQESNDGRKEPHRLGEQPKACQRQANRTLASLSPGLAYGGLRHI